MGGTLPANRALLILGALTILFGLAVGSIGNVTLESVKGEHIHIKHVATRTATADLAAEVRQTISNTLNFRAMAMGLGAVLVLFSLLLGATQLAPQTQTWLGFVTGALGFVYCVCFLKLVRNAPETSSIEALRREAFATQLLRMPLLLCLLAILLLFLFRRKPRHVVLDTGAPVHPADR
jgi:hypothetical protein